MADKPNGSKMATLFASLRGGDLLCIPCTECGADHTHELAVLGFEMIDGKPAIWLSRENPKHHPLPKFNPITWDIEKSLFVDRDGDPLPFGTHDFTVVRDGARAAFEQYEKRPKLRQPKLAITKDDVIAAAREGRLAEMATEVLLEAEDGKYSSVVDIVSTLLSSTGHEPTPTMVAAVVAASQILSSIESAGMAKMVVELTISSPHFDKKH